MLTCFLFFFPSAFILLHDPHADPSSPTCKSAEKLLNAARAILDLVYILCATSFDITLLDPVASFAWFLAARVFVRFLKARLDGRRRAEAIGIRNELEVIRLALRRMGERVPLGCELISHCGIQGVFTNYPNPVQSDKVKCWMISSLPRSETPSMTLCMHSAPKATTMPLLFPLVPHRPLI